MSYEQPDWLERTLAILLFLLPIGLWVIWWLWAVNWQKLAPVLRTGAWAPILLLMLIAASVWSRIQPSECTCLGFVTLPNFWWQLGTVIGLALVALFCGWLQGIQGWRPQEVSVEPAPLRHGHDHGHHGHGHGHDH